MESSDDAETVSMPMTEGSGERSKAQDSMMESSDDAEIVVMPMTEGSGEGSSAEDTEAPSGSRSCCPPPPVRAVSAWLGSHWGLFDEGTEVTDKRLVFHWYDILISLMGVALYMFDIYTDLRLAVQFFEAGDNIFGREFFPQNVAICVT